jgi:hypothetical protein
MPRNFPKTWPLLPHLTTTFDKQLAKQTAALEKK